MMPNPVKAMLAALLSGVLLLWAGTVYAIQVHEHLTRLYAA